MTCSFKRWFKHHDEMLYVPVSRQLSPNRYDRRTRPGSPERLSACADPRSPATMAGAPTAGEAGTE